MRILVVKYHRMRKVTTLLSGVVLIHCTAQNFLSNASFETFTECPDALGQVGRCVDWQEVVQSADFYHCGFIDQFNFPTPTGAFAGEGFMGFASYGDGNGSAEAIGQNLSTPLSPGSAYQFVVAAKRASGGGWGNDCGGLTVYGLPGMLPEIGLISTHAEDIEGAVLLAQTPMIDHIEWQTYEISIVPTSTIGSLIFTNQRTPNCSECIFLDGLSVSQPHGLAELTDAIVEIVSTPEGASLRVNQGGMVRYRVLDAMGRLQGEGMATGTQAVLTHAAAHGTYVISWWTKDGEQGAQRFVLAR